MILDFGLISVLLVLSHLIRSKVKVFQMFFLPTPIIAGFMALICGSELLDLLPFSEAETGARRIDQYPGWLVALLFATLFMGKRKKTASLPKALRNVGDTFFYNLAAEVGQYGLALIFGLLVLAPLFPSLNASFALLLPAGFVGGHGTATAIGNVLVEKGWDEALTVGYTFATIGLVSGVLGGVVLINIATRCGWTRFVSSPHELPVSMRTGFVPEGERAEIGKQTVDSIALDPLAWHVALVFVAFTVAHFVDNLAGRILPQHFALPLFALALLSGASLQKVLDLIRLGDFVDRRLMERIGSTVSDYLVAFGIASIKITVVVKYALPIVIMSLVGVAYSALMLLILGRRMFHNFWFERSLFVYGWNTGVVAIGIALLRVVDPRLRSRTLEDFGLAYISISFVVIGIIVVLPQLVASGNIAAPGFLLIAAFFACVLLSKSVIGWYKTPADVLREGEADAIARGQGVEHDPQE